MNCNDLRFIKTEENLKRSLLHILESCRLSDITIKAICEEARCSRNSFYQHYQTKESLYNAVLNDIFAAIEESTRPIDRNQKAMNDQKIKAYTYKLLKVIDEHRSEFKSLRNGNDLFLPLLSNSMYQSYMKHYSYVTDEKQITEQGRLITRYFCCGIVGFIEQWLSADNMSLETAQHNLDLCSHDNYKKMRDLLIQLPEA